MLGAVKASRPHGERANRLCDRCGIEMKGRPETPLCVDCQVAGRPISRRTLQKLRREERENPEAVAAFELGLRRMA